MVANMEALEIQMRAGGRPRIAVVMRNTLAANGLAWLIGDAVPLVEVSVYNGMDEIHDSELPGFVHYFISTDVLLERPAFFRANAVRTIVVTDGARSAAVAAGFRTIDTTLNTRLLLREFLKHMHAGHSDGRHLPAAPHRRDTACGKPHELTPREVEVLREVVTGHINKEIADRLNISLATVITHRRNIMEKLHAKSVATLAIYAVMRGIVSPDML